LREWSKQRIDLGYGCGERHVLYLQELQVRLLFVFGIGIVEEILISFPSRGGDSSIC
jgi:hypothetical protein